jgi:hypothetical protein
MKFRSLYRNFLLIVIIHFCACSTISTFHAETFTRTSALKAKTIVLMDHATEGYKIHEAKAEEILIEAETLYAMQKGREKNSVSLNQWKLLLEKDNSILKGFFKQWKQKQTLSEGVIMDFKELVAGGFDEILKLEGNKLKR